jgi:hypothetical protein
MSVIALHRDYPSIFAAPVVRAVDSDIFALSYFTHCMACGFCHDQCCDHGVDIDLANMERLRSLSPSFEKFVDVPQSEWFAPQIVEDREFPSGRHGRTNVAGGKCVFAERGGRGCRIHTYCLANGLDYHIYKPMVSVLFPLTFEHGVLVPSDEAANGSLVCSGDGSSLYEGVRGELAHFFGEELVTVLDSFMSSARSEVRRSAGVRAKR